MNIIVTTMSRGIPAVALLALASGCSHLATPPDWRDLQADTRQRVGARPETALTPSASAALNKAVQDRLQRTLSLADAVQIALLNNPEIHIRYWELGIAQADLEQAAKWPNPHLEFKRVHQQGSVSIERTWSVGFTELLMRPLTQKLERERYQMVYTSVSKAIVALADDVSRDYIQAVFTRQTLAYQNQVVLAAEAAAELGDAMRIQGNWSEQDALAQQLFHAEAVAGQMRARQAATAAEETLRLALGLRPEQSPLRLPEKLPPVPEGLPALVDIQQLALDQRYDIHAAQEQLNAAATRMDLTRISRVVNLLEPGYVRNSGANQEASGVGYDLKLEIPMFDWGEARQARASAEYSADAARLQKVALDAMSEVRLAWQDCETNLRLARHYEQHVVPLQKAISDQMLRRYNGMLSSVFELLGDARRQADTVHAAVSAEQAYWLAWVALQSALGGRVAEPLSSSADTTPAAQPEVTP